MTEQKMAELADELDGLAVILSNANTNSEAGFDDLCKRAADFIRAATAATQPVAWIVLSEETGNTRIWWRDKDRAEAWAAENNKQLIPLYAAGATA